jgi:hypothetical protein
MYNSQGTVKDGREEHLKKGSNLINRHINFAFRI